MHRVVIYLHKYKFYINYQPLISKSNGSKWCAILSFFSFSEIDVIHLKIYLKPLDIKIDSNLLKTWNMNGSRLRMCYMNMERKHHKWIDIFPIIFVLNEGMIEI